MRKSQIIMAVAVWAIGVFGVAVAAWEKASRPPAGISAIGADAVGEAGQEECSEPPAPHPQAGESAATLPSALAKRNLPPELPVIGPIVTDSAPSTGLPLPLDAKVARSAPSASLLPPQGVSTAEPPLIETTSAKPPAREDNVWHGEPMRPAPPRPLALCLWSAAACESRPPRKFAVKATAPFVGMFCCRLDEQKKLVLPQEVSEQMGMPRRVFVTPGPQDCLWLCNAAALERLADRLDANARRLYLAQTARVVIDPCGRLILPEALGGFQRESVLLGSGDHFELWDAQHWQRYVDQEAVKSQR